MQVFIGSSSESIEKAKCLRDILNAHQSVKEVIPWWRGDVFENGVAYIETLHSYVNVIDAAVMVFSEDDKVVIEEELNTPRETTYYMKPVFFQAY